MAISDMASRLKLRPMIDDALLLVLLATCLAVFIPFTPKMPGSGLDNSWQFGINQMLAQGLAFGKDIIFTAGPYASVYTRTYHPATDGMMLLASLYLALSYWGGLVYLSRGVQWRWTIGVCVVFASVLYSRDALLFSYPLMAGMAGYRLIAAADASAPPTRRQWLGLALLFAPFGLLPLTKGSMFFLCLATIALFTGLAVSKRRVVEAGIGLASPVLAMVAFWLAADQGLAALPAYLGSLAEVTSGYAEAMAMDGNPIDIVLFVAATAALLWSLFRLEGVQFIPKLYLLGLFSLFLFIAFKGGFVRHDFHAVMAAGAILIAALFFPFATRTPTPFAAVVLALLAWAYIDSHLVRTSTEKVFNNIRTTYVSAWNGFKLRMGNGPWPRNDYEAALRSMRDEAAFPPLAGSTDIYSHNQSLLIASGNTWAPRPVFQSYSAYTPWLAERNAAHLSGTRAPDNILFAVEPIGGRMPSGDDGASWPALLANYQPERMLKEYLLLRKKPAIPNVAGPARLASENHVLGEPVMLPKGGKPIFARIDIRPSLLGRVVGFLFKPGQLRIELRLNSGDSRNYHLLSGVAGGGILLSPLIESTAEFTMLYGAGGDLDGKAVTAFTVKPKGSSLLWQDEYSVTFFEVAVTSNSNVSQVLNLDRFTELPPGGKVAVAAQCHGGIDMLNGAKPAPKQASASRLFSASGWLATSVAAPVVPEAVYLTLSDRQGRTLYLKAHATPRPDVAKHFKKPELDKSGYKATGDVSSLQGDYGLGVAYQAGGTVYRCPQPHGTVRINQ